MRELVRHHPFQLGGVEQSEDPARGAHRGGLAAAAHRERVGHRGLHYAHARLGQIGLHAQPFHDPVQLWLLGGGDLLDPHRGHGQFVGGEQLQQQQRAGDDRDRDPSHSDGEQHADEHDIEQPQQEQRE